MLTLYGKELNIPDALVNEYKEKTLTDLRKGYLESLIHANTEYDMDSEEDVKKIKNMSSEQLEKLIISCINNELRYFGR